MEGPKRDKTKKAGRQADHNHTSSSLFCLVLWVSNGERERVKVIFWRESVRRTSVYSVECELAKKTAEKNNCKILVDSVMQKRTSVFERIAFRN